MANIYRFLSNVRRDDNMKKLVEEIDNMFPETRLGGETPFPNQVLPTANTNGTPICLYFEQFATDKLNKIRRLAQRQSNFRITANKSDKSIEFVCLGYQDKDGDIVIYDIGVPSIEPFKNPDKKTVNLNKFFNRTNSKEISNDTEDLFLNHLRSKEALKYFNGKTPVALWGCTKPIVTTKNKSEYCPKFSEIAKAIVPGNIEFKSPIITGLLTVSPIYMAQTPDGIRPKDGSLECILVNYKANSNNTQTPISFTNVTRCQQTESSGELKVVDISKSYQPIDGLPNYSDVLIKK